MDDVKITSYPEGWEKIKKELLDGIPEEEKEGFMMGWANNLLSM